MGISATISRIGGEPARGAFSGRSEITERRGLVLELRDGQNAIGRGEASPLAGFHRETVDQIDEALARIVKQLAPFDRVDADAVAAVRPSLAREAGIVRFAFETAVLDLSSKRSRPEASDRPLPEGLPLALLDPRLAAWRDVAIPLSAFGGPLLGADALTKAREAAARGFRVVKYKADGADLVGERRAIRAIRAIVEVRLDLNGALLEANVERALEAYAAAGVSLVEEPASLTVCRQISAFPLPWFIDESLAESTADDRARASGVVLKPALLGLSGAIDRALEARAAKKAVIVTHMFDGPIALAAACELALAVGDPEVACGLDLHAGLAAYPSVRVPQIDGAFVRRRR